MERTDSILFCTNCGQRMPPIGPASTSMRAVDTLYDWLRMHEGPFALRWEVVDVDATGRGILRGQPCPSSATARVVRQEVEHPGTDTIDVDFHDLPASSGPSPAPSATPQQSDWVDTPTKHGPFYRRISPEGHREWAAANPFGRWNAGTEDPVAPFSLVVDTKEEAFALLRTTPPVVSMPVQEPPTPPVGRGRITASKPTIAPPKHAGPRRLPSGRRDKR